MTRPPPALATPPQFSPAYWAKAPREMFTAHIERVTNLEEGWVEIVMKEGMALRRERKHIQQLLAPNAEVQLETFNKELVTGLLVPGVGWAFRMTSEDLAEYAKALSVEMHKQRLAAEQAMISHVGVNLDSALEAMDLFLDDSNYRAEVALNLAAIAVASLKTGPA